MISKWFDLRNRAISRRKSGISIGQIERELGIPRSTLSGWFKNTHLTEFQKKKLYLNSKKGLVLARKRAVMWHNRQRQLRIRKAQEEAIQTLSKIDVNNKSVLELALAMLYLGEGSKSNLTSMGNTNPLILRFFIRSIEILFGVSKASIMCDLHLRSNQSAKEAIKYWSRELGLSKTKFIVMKDKRVAKSKTFAHYKGVCNVRFGRIAIQRRIVHLAEEFSKIAIARSVSSVGRASA